MQTSRIGKQTTSMLFRLDRLISLFRRIKNGTYQPPHSEENLLQVQIYDENY